MSVATAPKSKTEEPTAEPTETPETEPTEPTLLPLAEYLAQVADDSSKITAQADRTEALAQWEKATEAMAVGIQAENRRTGATERAASALFAFRLTIRRENGAPDFAGGTTLYQTSVGTYWNHAAANLKDADGNPLLREDGKPYDKDDVRRFRSAVHTFISDHQWVQIAELEYAAKNDQKAIDAGVTQKAIDELKAKGSAGKLTGPMKTAIKRQMRTQTATNDPASARLNGQKEENVMQAFGLRQTNRKAQKKSGTTQAQGNASAKVEPAEAFQIVEDHLKSEKVSLTQAATDLHKSVSALAENIIGRKVADIADVAGLSAVLQGLADSCVATIGYLAEDGTDAGDVRKTLLK